MVSQNEKIDWKEKIYFEGALLWFENGYQSHTDASIWGTI